MVGGSGPPSRCRSVSRPPLPPGCEQSPHYYHIIPQISGGNCRIISPCDIRPLQNGYGIRWGKNRTVVFSPRKEILGPLCGPVSLGVDPATALRRHGGGGVIQWHFDAGMFGYGCIWFMRKGSRWRSWACLPSPSGWKRRCARRESGGRATPPSCWPRAAGPCLSGAAKRARKKPFKVMEGGANVTNCVGGLAVPCFLSG